MTSITTGWEKQPAEHINDWTWVHVPVRANLDLVVTSLLPHSYLGHWYARLMYPCTGNACPLCARRIGRQRRYVLSVFDLSLRQPALLELGESTAHQIQDIQGAADLRNLQLRMTREAPRAKGRVIVSLLPPGAVLPEPLPPEHDIKTALQSTWARHPHIGALR